MADSGEEPLSDAVMAALTSRIAGVPGLAEALPSMSEEQRATVLTNLLLAGAAGADADGDIQKQLAALATAMAPPPAPGDTSRIVTPTPGFVVKTLMMQQWRRPVSGPPAGRASAATAPAEVPPGTKVFINIAAHDAVAAIRRVKRLKEGASGDGEEEEGISIPVAVGDTKDDVDKHAAAVLVVDVIVHPAVLADVERDMTGAFRHFLSELATQYVERKHGMALSAQYRIPPGLKYKGETVTSQRVRAQAADLAGKISAADSEDASPLQVLVRAGAIAQPVVQASSRRTPALAAVAPSSSSSSNAGGVRGKYSAAMDVRVLPPPSTGAVNALAANAPGGAAEASTAAAPSIAKLLAGDAEPQHAQGRVLIQETDAIAAEGASTSHDKPRKRVQFVEAALGQEAPEPLLRESRSVRIPAPGITPLFAVFVHVEGAWREVGWEGMPDTSSAVGTGSMNPLHARASPPAPAAGTASHLRIRAIVEPRAAYETSKLLLMLGFPSRPGSADVQPLDLAEGRVTLADLHDHVRVDMPAYRPIDVYLPWPVDVHAAICDEATRVMQVHLTFHDTAGLPRIPHSLLRTSDVEARGLPPDTVCPLADEAADALLLTYARHAANVTTPDPGTKQWMVLHALHDPRSRDEDRQVEAAAPAEEPADTPYREGEALPEDAFHASDALSQHFIRQREEERAKRAEERAAAAAAEAPAVAAPPVDAAVNSMDAQIARIDLSSYVLSARAAKIAVEVPQLVAALRASGVAVDEAELRLLPGVASGAVWELL